MADLYLSPLLFCCLLCFISLIECDKFIPSALDHIRDELLAWEIFQSTLFNQTILSVATSLISYAQQSLRTQEIVPLVQQNNGTCASHYPNLFYDDQLDRYWGYETMEKKYIIEDLEFQRCCISNPTKEREKEFQKAKPECQEVCENDVYFKSETDNDSIFDNKDIEKITKCWVCNNIQLSLVSKCQLEDTDGQNHVIDSQSENPTWIPPFDNLKTKKKHHYQDYLNHSLRIWSLNLFSDILLQSQQTTNWSFSQLGPLSSFYIDNELSQDSLLHPLSTIAQIFFRNITRLPNQFPNLGKVKIENEQMDTFLNFLSNHLPLENLIFGFGDPNNLVSDKKITSLEERTTLIKWRAGGGGGMGMQLICGEKSQNISENDVVKPLIDPSEEESNENQEKSKIGGSILITTGGGGGRGYGFKFNTEIETFESTQQKGSTYHKNDDEDKLPRQRDTGLSISLSGSGSAGLGGGGGIQVFQNLSALERDNHDPLPKPPLDMIGKIPDSEIWKIFRDYFIEYERNNTSPIYSLSQGGGGGGGLHWNLPNSILEFNIFTPHLNPIQFKPKKKSLKKTKFSNTLHKGILSRIKDGSKKDEDAIFPIDLNRFQSNLTNKIRSCYYENNLKLWGGGGAGGGATLSLNIGELGLSKNGIPHTNFTLQVGCSLATRFYISLSTETRIPGILSVIREGKGINKDQKELCAELRRM